MHFLLFVCCCFGFYFGVLFCFVLFLYCFVLFCIALYCFLLLRIALNCFELFCIVRHTQVLHFSWLAVLAGSIPDVHDECAPASIEIVSPRHHHGFSQASRGLRER